MVARAGAAGQPLGWAVEQGRTSAGAVGVLQTVVFSASADWHEPRGCVCSGPGRRGEA
jgi:hypothetical protein